MDIRRRGHDRPDPLPGEEIYVTCRDYMQVADAIRTMVIRGAPAIGVAAAMGVAIGVVEPTTPFARSW